MRETRYGLRRKFLRSAQRGSRPKIEIGRQDLMRPRDRLFSGDSKDILHQSTSQCGSAMAWGKLVAPGEANRAAPLRERSLVCEAVVLDTYF